MKAGPEPTQQTRSDPTTESTTHTNSVHAEPPATTNHTEPPHPEPVQLVNSESQAEPAHSEPPHPEYARPEAPHLDPHNSEPVPHLDPHNSEPVAAHLDPPKPEPVPPQSEPTPSEPSRSEAIAQSETQAKVNSVPEQIPEPVAAVAGPSSSSHTTHASASSSSSKGAHANWGVTPDVDRPITVEAEGFAAKVPTTVMQVFQLAVQTHKDQVIYL